ncbi:quinone oxidoreductase family protein [Entomobacter blattae]|uniref:Phthiocerol/phenolphthiocerol synthesis polyketide synthase type I PpsC n=1 Tax=Entomobacter blattae TaxID=2762277 RepID=A0A7H1NNM9_9PROT|nr:zinc-binding alcohol dehydrogenase family protein [Entomobacter blattae]QNT77389.1 Phthiocerol/phenolphthiocerol synthesis polyketide synthase type I PpsC [Entomobacter blattae]
MKALQFDRFGGPEVLSLQTIPDPVLKEGFALVAVKAASVNPSDVGNVAGNFPYTTLPRVPGRDYSGIVIDGPKEWMGAEVWGAGNFGFAVDGTHAEKLLVPVASLRKKPETLTHEQAAAVGITFVTAWLGVVDYASLKKGETLVVVGAGGGVGSAAVQIGKYLGARVIGLVRNPIENGSPVIGLADHIEVVGASDYNSTVRGLTDGKGADVIINTVGRDTFEPSLQALAHRGRMAVLASPGQRKQSFDLIDFYHNESQLFGVDSLKKDVIASAMIMEEIKNGFDKKAFMPPMIENRFSLEQGAEAYKAVVAGAKGKIIIVP